jgi:hypothetical protein
MAMKVLKAAAIAFALSLAAPVALANPVTSEIGSNLVVNGDFETGDFSGWTESGVIAGHTGVTTAPFAHTGTYGMFAGAIGGLHLLSQDIATVSGVNYNIHLWIESNGTTPNELRVSWGGTIVYDAVDMGAFSYMEIVIDPMATGAIMTLEIGTRNDPNFLSIDDISVFATAAVPEPANLALLALVLAGLSFSARRRQARRA